MQCKAATNDDDFFFFDCVWFHCLDHAFNFDYVSCPQQQRCRVSGEHCNQNQNTRTMRAPGKRKSSLLSQSTRPNRFYFCGQSLPFFHSLNFNWTLIYVPALANAMDEILSIIVMCQLICALHLSFHCLTDRPTNRTTWTPFRFRFFHFEYLVHTMDSGELVFLTIFIRNQNAVHCARTSRTLTHMYRMRPLTLSLEHNGKSK